MTGAQVGTAASMSSDLRTHQHRPRCHGRPALHQGAAVSGRDGAGDARGRHGDWGILAEHPDLTAEDIHESLLYAAEAVRERELPLRLTA